MLVLANTTENKTKCLSVQTEKESSAAPDTLCGTANGGG